MKSISQQILSMKKTLKKTNKVIVGELKQNGLCFDWYVEDKKLYKIEFPSMTAGWWFLKGVLLMSKLAPMYRKEMNKKTLRRG